MRLKPRYAELTARKVEQTRVCRVCGKEKPIKEYTRASGINRISRRSECRECEYAERRKSNKRENFAEWCDERCAQGLPWSKKLWDKLKFRGDNIAGVGRPGGFGSMAYARAQRDMDVSEAWEKQRAWLPTLDDLRGDDRNKEHRSDLSWNRMCPGEAWEKVK